jgi:hypothetical protein
MVTYIYEDGFYKVIGGDGLIYAAFTTEWEAQDYCDKHNPKEEL